MVWKHKHLTQNSNRNLIKVLKSCEKEGCIIISIITYLSSAKKMNI